MQVPRLRSGKIRRFAIAAAAAFALTTVTAGVADAHPVLTSMQSTRQVALAFFSGQLFIAWISNDSNNTLNIAHSADGINFSPPFQPFGSGNSHSAPALAFFDNKLWMAWTGTDANSTLNLASSDDGMHFTQATQPLGRNNSDDGPALAVFANRLYYGWKGTDSNHTLNIASSSDGVRFTAPIQPNRNTSVNAPALAAWNNRLYMGWAGTDTNHHLNLASSGDGVHFTQFAFQFGTRHQPSMIANPFTGGLAIDYTATNDDFFSFTYTGSASVAPVEFAAAILEAPTVTAAFGMTHALLNSQNHIVVCIETTNTC